MAATFVSENVQSNVSSGSDKTLTFASTAFTTGDIVTIDAIANNGGATGAFATLLTPTGGTGVTWTLVRPVQNGDSTSGSSTGAWWALIPSNQTSTFAQTTNRHQVGDALSTRGVMRRWQGVDTVTPIRQAVGYGSAATDPLITNTDLQLTGMKAGDAACVSGGDWSAQTTVTTQLDSGLSRTESINANEAGQMHFISYYQSSTLAADDADVRAEMDASAATGNWSAVMYALATAGGAATAGGGAQSASLVGPGSQGPLAWQWRQRYGVDASAANVSSSANAVAAQVDVTASNPTTTVSSAASAVNALVTVTATNPTVSGTATASAVNALATVTATNPTYTVSSAASAVAAPVTVTATNPAVSGTATASAVNALVTVTATNPTTTTGTNANAVSALVTVTATNPTETVLSNANAVGALVTVTATNPTYKVSSAASAVNALVTVTATNPVGQGTATASAVNALVTTTATNPTETVSSAASAVNALVTATATNPTYKVSSAASAVNALVTVTATNPVAVGTLIIPVATLTLAGVAPSVTGTGSASRTLTTGTLTLAGVTPSLNATGSVTFALSPSARTLAGVTPALAGSGTTSFALPVAAVLLTAVQPLVVTKVLFTIPVATLTLVAVVPNLTSGGQRSPHVTAVATKLHGVSAQVVPHDGGTTAVPRVHGVGAEAVQRDGGATSVPRVHGVNVEKGHGQ